MNLKDTALQSTTPTVMVPKFEALEPLASNGHRFLMATDGLWLEVKRSWCHIVQPLGLKTSPVPMPYGSVQRKVELAFKKIPLWMIEKFTAQAVQMHPVETGAVGIYNFLTDSFRYELCDTVKAGVGHLKARWPTALGEGESIVLDMHSHGPIDAYFSSQDIKDMGADTVIACVVGQTDQQQPQIEIAIFAAGMEIKIKSPSLGAQTQSVAEVCHVD